MHKKQLGQFALTILCATFLLAAAVLGYGRSGGHRSAHAAPANPTPAATGTTTPGAPPAFPSTWPQYRLDDAHTGVLYQPGAPSYHWTSHVNDSLFTDTTVGNGLLYVGSIKGDVYAFDARTGAVRWRYQTENWIMTHPIVADGRVFVATGNRYYQPQRHWDPTTAFRGSGKNAVYALDAATGRLIWRFVTRAGNMPTPVYSDGVLYLVGGDRMVYAFDAKTGWLRWELPIPSIDSMSSPVLSGNLLVFGGGYPNALYAVNIQTHQLQWVQPTPGTGGLTDAPPTIANGSIYITAFSSRGLKNGADRAYEYAIRLADGKMLWVSALGTGKKVKDNTGGATEVVNGVLYFGHPELGSFLALSAATGKVLWRFTMKAAVKGGAAVVAGKVYFAGSTGILYALNAANGKEIAARKLNGKVVPGGVTVVGTTLYVPTRTGYLYAIPLADLGSSAS